VPYITRHTQVKIRDFRCVINTIEWHTSEQHRPVVVVCLVVVNVVVAVVGIVIVVADVTADDVDIVVSVVETFRKNKTKST